MITLQATVKSKYGIHARPSMFLYKVAEQFPDTDITITDLTNNTKAKANSILQLMLLSSSYGSIVSICALGGDEEKAAKAIANVIETFEGEIE